MSLFSITEKFRELFDAYDEIVNAEPEDNTDPEEMRRIAEEAWFNTLSDMEDTIEEKAENLALFIMDTEAEISAMKAAEKRLAERRRAKENAVKRLKEYGIRALDAAKLTKVDRPLARLSIRNNAESVEISDEKGFIDWAQRFDRDDLLRYAEPTINKSAIKEIIKNGQDVPFASLRRTRSLIIK